jgi:hypothetical protein
MNTGGPTSGEKIEDSKVLDEPTAAPSKLQLTAALHRVLQEVGTEGNGEKKQALTLGLIIDATGERAFGVLMAFLCLPFLTPIPLPGLSIPFGIALMLLGLQVAVRRHRPWLPARMMALNLPPKFGPQLIAFVAKVFQPLERVIKPRLLFMQNPMAMVLVGVALAIDGFVLSLPLPPVVPLSNALPAWIALVKILGITEEDGVSLIAGTVLTLSFVLGVIMLAILAWGKMKAWW